MRSLNTEKRATISTHFVDGLDSDDARLPQVLCLKCNTIVLEAQRGVFDRSIDLFNYSLLAGDTLKPVTRASSVCPCTVCKIGKLKNNAQLECLTPKTPKGRPWKTVLKTQK